MSCLFVQISIKPSSIIYSWGCCNAPQLRKQTQPPFTFKINPLLLSQVSHSIGDFSFFPISFVLSYFSTYIDGVSRTSPTYHDESCLILFSKPQLRLIRRQWYNNKFEHTMRWSSSQLIRDKDIKPHQCIGATSLASVRNLVNTAMMRYGRITASSSNLSFRVAADVILFASTAQSLVFRTESACFFLRSFLWNGPGLWSSVINHSDNLTGPIRSHGLLSPGYLHLILIVVPVINDTSAVSDE